MQNFYLVLKLVIALLDWRNVLLLDLSLAVVHAVLERIILEEVLISGVEHLVDVLRWSQLGSSDVILGNYLGFVNLARLTYTILNNDLKSLDDSFVVYKQLVLDGSILVEDFL